VTTGAASVQATVATFDPATGAGTVLLDDGRRASFDGAAFAAGGLRLLRLGQRVRLEYDDDRVVRVTIHTLP
jgi:cold shock CspA family protein